METPQVFSRELIDRAYARVAKKKLRITDDAQAVEGLDHPIALLENTEANPKLTTPADLAYLEFLLARSAPVPVSSDSSAPFPPRTPI
jgi:2-C-methyl-D-erythritol 4-phosphate cytidylyltransferase